MVNHDFSLPVYIAKGVATSGHFADLGPLVVGIYDRKTSSVATATGNGKEFFLCGGSPHTRDSLTKFYKGMKSPKKSSYFLGKDIISFEKAYPSRAVNEEWVLGYDGSTTSKSLAYECGKQYQLKIRLYGEPAFTMFNKSLEKIISLNTPCCEGEECPYDCPDHKIGVKEQTIEWVRQINEHVEFQEFKIKAYPVFSDYAATAPNANEYTLTVVDNGDAVALQDVQRANPGKEIYIIKRAGNTSVYGFKGTAAPANFTPKASVLLAVCGVCEAGYTLVAERNAYMIKRQLSGQAGTGTASDLDDPTARDAYVADAVTDYGGVAGSGVFLGIADGMASVKILKQGTIAAPIESDIIESVGTTPAYCTPVTPAAITWATGKGLYTVTRTLQVTISDQDCEFNYTAADINAYFADVPSFVDGSAAEINATDNCTKTFTIEQVSKFMEDACMSPDVADYDELPAFHGYVFTVQPGAAEVYDATIKAGIRITAPFYSVKFGDTSFDETEYYDAEPLRMEVSLFDQNLKPCAFSKLADARRTRLPKYRRMSGEFVLRQYIAQGVYFVYENWSTDQRMQEVIDNTALKQVKREAYYVAYYLKFKEARPDENFNQKGHIFESVIYVEEGDFTTQLALENALSAVTAKFHVGIENRIPV